MSARWMFEDILFFCLPAVFARSQGNCWVCKLLTHNTGPTLLLRVIRQLLLWADQ